MGDALIYCRVSDDHDGTSRSVDQQERECRQWCDDNGHAVLEVVIDSDISASRYSRRSRPGWARVLELIESGVADVLVAWDLDRLLRQPRELEHLIDLADKGMPVRVLGGGDVNLASADGRFVARILVAKAAKESDDISRRVRRAKAAKAARGEPARLERPMAFGWRDGVTPEPAEAELICESARRLLAGEVGVTALAREWTAAGWRRPRSGRAWSSTTVRGVLESPRNAGLRVHRGEVVGDGNWPAIVDRMTYERLRALFADPGRKQAPRRVTTFTGVYRCHRCQGVLTLDQANGRRIWRCKPHAGHPRCGAVGLTAKRADAVVLEALFAAVDVGHSPTPPPAPVDAAPRANELADVEQRLLDIAEDYAAGRITRAQFLAATETLTKRREALVAAVGGAQRPTAALPYLGRPGTLESIWDDLDDGTRNAVVRSVIDRVLVGPRTPGAPKWDPSRLRIAWAI